MTNIKVSSLCLSSLSIAKGVIAYAIRNVSVDDADAVSACATAFVKKVSASEYASYSDAINAYEEAFDEMHTPLRSYHIILNGIIEVFAYEVSNLIDNELDEEDVFYISRDEFYKDDAPTLKKVREALITKTELEIFKQSEYDKNPIRFAKVTF